MKDYLKRYLMEMYPETKGLDANECLEWHYKENINVDANNGKWLEKKTSFIYKVSVLCAIDNNKCDYVFVAIGTQRDESSDPEFKGALHFCDGENDDIGRVIKRAKKLMESIHPVFECIW